MQSRAFLFPTSIPALYKRPNAVIMMDQGHVILVRSPRQPAETDPYSAAFVSSRFVPHHLPVLETSFLNQLDLAERIAKGGHEQYAGVIITSVRSAEAWTLASRSSNRPDGWKRIPFFVVGPATKDAVTAMTRGESSLENDQIVVGAKETGSGEKLGQFIVDYLSTSTSASSSLPLLYLVGDKNRDTIRRILTAASIPLQLLQVYETHPAPEFESRLGDYLASLAYSLSSPRTCWITLFSPSGSKPCLDALRHRRLIGKDKMDQGLTIKLAVIGPTTREYVEDEEGITVDADAGSPAPSALVQAIEEADRIV